MTMTEGDRRAGRVRSMLLGLWLASMHTLFGCATPANPPADRDSSPIMDAAMDSAMDAQALDADVTDAPDGLVWTPFDGDYRAQCIAASTVTGWGSSTEIREMADDGVCPATVAVDGFAGNLDCGSFEACCDIAPWCRFRVDLTFHDNRRDRCTGASPCFPPVRSTSSDCRCENGVIRCGGSSQWAFPVRMCSDCNRPRSCGDGGFPD